MTLWISQLDERGRPRRADTECVRCGTPIDKGTTAKRKYCAPCRQWANRESKARWAAWH